MTNAVFANNMEVSCKAGSGKTICAFPDVCFTPPQTPATPPGVPIPYPNTGRSSDATDGSRTVKIGGQEAMLKNKSCFKKSTGDEAGSTPKKGVITSKITGKVYFNAWSMDVKFEGENVVRHLDLTTHNHGSQPGQTPPFPETEGMSGGAASSMHKIMCAIKECDKKHHDIRKTKKGRNMPRRARCSALGTKKHKCVSDALKGMESQGVRSEVPYSKGTPKGLSANRRPDIVVHTPPAKPPHQPCAVIDAKFPCSEATKRRKRKHLKGQLESRPVTGYDYMKNKPTAKEFDDYETIAGGGPVIPITPEDCKNEVCP